MNDHDPEYPENPQLSIAAALHLLSSANTHGISAARCQALLQHLERLAVDASLAEPLRHTCYRLYCTWNEIMYTMQYMEKTDSPGYPCFFQDTLRLH
ncbi:MAG: hypothetical protein LBR88_03350 [Zoogloeaceae bacterium]|jgi:hypothetical protein|nr:hypothetical protein [Zoogloeaceae bacterium]